MTGHNPDILTCLANLSADEVFTPPRLAAAMLDILPQDLFRRPDTTFLDPVCKSGVFLREIARRLNDGLRDQMPEDQARINHILTRQVFGLAITELTSYLSRRSVYCSKKADGKYSIATAFTQREGNIRLPATQHQWSTRAGSVSDGVIPRTKNPGSVSDELPGQTKSVANASGSSKCAYCGANRGEYERDETLEAYAYPFIHGIDPREVFNVKFDVIIGNPPYQLSDGGFGRSASPIYHQFVMQAKKLEPRYLTMVIPARWFAGGKGLDEFRESMLTDNRLRAIDDYLSASDVFQGIGLKGGICYFLWDRDNPGPCRVTTHFKDWPAVTANRPLLEEGVDVFIRFNEGVSILKKVVAVESGTTQSLSLPEDKRFDQLVSSRKPFGLVTTFKGKAVKRAGDVLVYQNGGVGYTPRSSITTGADLIDKWKLFAGYAAPGTGNKDTYPHRIISTPFVGEPGSISSETYLCIGPFDSQVEAESVLSYLSCRLTRLLILLHKPSQHVTRKVYNFVPTQEWTRQWTDEDLYAKYALSKSEIAFIEKIVRPMDITGCASDEVIPDVDDDE